MLVAIFLSSLLNTGWAQTSARPVASVPKGDVAKGRIAYMTCTQCHNKDPNKKGPIGPELVDAPYEIMLWKVVNGGGYPATLPAGFVPKRKSKAMKKIPNSVKDVPNIYAWIQSVKLKK